MPATISYLKVFNKFSEKDLKVWLNIQLHNWNEAVHIEILRLDPKKTWKFIGRLTTYFIKEIWLQKWDLVFANANNIDLIYK